MENFYVKPGTGMEPQDSPQKPEPKPEVRSPSMRKSSLPPIVPVIGADIYGSMDRRNSSIVKKKKKKKRKVQQVVDPELEAKILEDLKDVVKEEPEATPDDEIKEQ